MTGTRVFLEEALAASAVRFGINLPKVVDSLARYADLLMAWNERINLTGAGSLDALARGHLSDTFAVVPHLPTVGRCIDVGSGAGLPGVVLALVRRDLDFTLLEPRYKRAAFLRRVSRELDLARVRILEQRLEEHLAEAAHSYDFAVARAVFPLADWLKICRGLVRPGGLAVGLAGADAGPLPAECEGVPYDVGAGPRLVVRLAL